MKKIEILAPVGSPENLKAACYSGADAIYLGASTFSARDSATNFSNEELEQSVKFCHSRDIKVFVAVNTLIKDSEIDNVIELVGFLCNISVDALIVQDLGLFYILRQACPDMPIHCSTQMSIASISSANLMYELGAKRLVLAREMTLDEISIISKEQNIETEVFVHGALCMCVSGQCYFSAMLGSRSGNRGRCAQTCRLPFKAKNGNGYDLSLKDLSYIDNISKLENINVSSAKIEGRMKRPEYVSAAVKSAVQMRDEKKIEPNLKENLHNVFSRSGFTSGYLDGKIDENMFGIRTKLDVTKGSSSVFASLHELYRTELQKIPLDLEITVLVGEKAKLKATDNKGNFCEVASEKPSEKAINKALSANDLKQRLSKLGGTSYFADKIKINTDEMSSLPASSINSLRREMIEKITILRQNRNKIDFQFSGTDLKHRKSDTLKLRAEFTSLSQIPKNTDIFECIFIPLDAPVEHFSSLLDRKSKIGAIMPSIAFGDDKKIEEKAKILQEIGINDFVCPNLYAVEIARKIGAQIHGAFSLNITNSYSLKMFENIGLNSAEVSFELKGTEISNLKSTIPRGLMLYGRQTLMVTRNCPQKKTKDACSSCSSKEELIDRKDTKIPVTCSKYRDNGKNYGCLSQYSKILNPVPLFLLDRMNEIENIDFGILRFTTETSSEIVDILADFKNKNNTVKPCTYGLFYRGII